VAPSDCGERFANGVIYSAGGEIIDAAKRLPLGKFTGVPPNACVQADSALGRTVFLGSGADSTTARLAVFDQRRIISVGSLDITGVSGKVASFIRMDTDRLAFRTADQVFIFGTSLLVEPRTGGQQPTVDGLVPSSAVAGGGNLILTVAGSNFSAYSVVRWNGRDRGTRFESGRQLIAFIPTTDVRVPGSASVTVFDPLGGTSTSASFIVYPPLNSPPAVNPFGVVDGASFKPKAPLAGGQLVSLFGSNLAVTREFATGLPLPTVLGGVTVRVNGIPAPLFFVSPEQINFVVPWELLTESQASVTVTVGGARSVAETVTLAPAAPGIFSTSQAGTGQGAVIIAGTMSVAAPRGSIPGARPAMPGEFASIFCSGLGMVTNRPANGEAASRDVLSTTLTVPSVTIGGLPATVTFWGLAPSFVALYQVNAQVPANAPTGDAIPVVLSIGGVTSNTVTIAVQ
jgi:uncharacterized protein (TIGR03437 family)